MSVMLALALLFAAAPRPAIVSFAPMPAQVKRIVSASPTITETVCAIGACPRLVGVTRFCDFPEQVKQLPKIGGFVDPSVEATVALKPDLVLLTKNGANKPFTEALDKQQIAWLAFYDDTLSDYDTIARTLGKVLGLPQEAKAAAERFDADLQLLDRQQKLDGKRVLIVYGHSPLIAAGPETFGAELLQRIGAKNAYKGEQRYPSLDLETLVGLKPDLVIDVDMLANGQSDPAYYTPVKRLLSGTSFVFAPDPALLRLGPRLPGAMVALRVGIGMRGPR